MLSQILDPIKPWIKKNYWVNKIEDFFFWDVLCSVLCFVVIYVLFSFMFLRLVFCWVLFCFVSECGILALSHLSYFLAVVDRILPSTSSSTSMTSLAMKDNVKIFGTKSGTDRQTNRHTGSDDCQYVSKVLTQLLAEPLPMQIWKKYKMKSQGVNICDNYEIS